MQQQIYLEQMRLFGKPSLAAETAGTSLEIIQAYKKHLDKDNLFAKAETLALQIRSETIASRLETEFLEGLPEPILDATGKQVMVKVADPNSATGYREIPGWKRKYEPAARLRMLERHDPSYREHKEVDINHKTGAMITPPSASLDDFRKLAAEVSAAQQLT